MHKEILFISHELIVVILHHFSMMDLVTFNAKNYIGSAVTATVNNGSCCADFSQKRQIYCKVTNNSKSKDPSCP